MANRYLYARVYNMYTEELWWRGAVANRTCFFLLFFFIFFSDSVFRSQSARSLLSPLRCPRVYDNTRADAFLPLHRQPGRFAYTSACTSRKTVC